VVWIAIDLSLLSPPQRYPCGPSSQVRGATSQGDAQIRATAPRRQPSLSIPGGRYEKRIGERINAFIEIGPVRAGKPAASRARKGQSRRDGSGRDWPGEGRVPPNLARCCWHRVRPGWSIMLVLMSFLTFLTNKLITFCFTKTTRDMYSISSGSPVGRR
jgi:hypothetical protein